MWIKICGIRNVETAERVAALAPDAIGLNFYDQSPRCVEQETAAKIVAGLPPDVEPVAVFVNATAERVAEVCRTCGIRTVQLHGDESPEFVGRLNGLQVIRAFRVGDGDLPSIAADLDRYQTLGIPLRACLIDARVEGAYGGTGHTAPWETLATGWQADWPPLILAGGLKPDNIRQAIEVVHPWGVDVASGVESSSGGKDLNSVAAFIASARGR
ncbi:MAG: phosphoribosylanthranilate isomerase [Planctomycetota bacterium]|nr:MAG: phosphoribosylanthranilate isomerase [Planctomycetota bacterium]REJ91015.1 MAG: phosphoribosylanthranilate isomerase [Planctomycetota bacterium]REK31025.1 MAG: phosphoribosylanthranilate isomerase [Planctomycetota bacterium]REK36858.1 MAG: phosphoribosylanthranilate isomerase [Planctomycetota bacterium]